MELEQVSNQQFLDMQLNIEKGKGGKCFDINGREFVDFQMAYGAIILGHSSDLIKFAIAPQLNRGILLPGKSSISRDLAERLLRIFPYDGSTPSKVLFRKTGSEAMLAATRLARAFTSRSFIVRCGYHGWFDWCADGFFPEYYGDNRFSGASLPKGITLEALQTTTRLDLNNLENFRNFVNNHKLEIACITIAPEELLPPITEKINKIIDIARKNNVLIILDEIKTAFRARWGGVYSMLEQKPDILVISKGLANGLPLAAVLGRPELMDMAADCFLSSTYEGELLSMVAAIACLEELESNDIVSQLNVLGQQFITTINGKLTHLKIEGAKAIGWPFPCMPFIMFRSSINVNAKIFETFAAEKGVLVYGDHMWFICSDHSEEDVDFAANSIVAAISKLVNN